MKLRNTMIALTSCVALAATAIGCDSHLPTEGTETTLTSALKATAVGQAKALESATDSLTTMLDTERTVRLRYEAMRDGHVLLSSTLIDGVVEVLNFRADRIDREVLEVLEEEVEITGMVTPSPKTRAFRMAGGLEVVVDASPREVAERLVATTAPTLCGAVRARATVILTLGATRLPVTANYVPAMSLKKAGQGSSVIKAVECLMEQDIVWTGGDCAHEGGACTKIYNRAKRIRKVGCQGGSSGGSVGGTIGVNVKPGQLPGVGVEVGASSTYRVQWWEHSTSEQEERSFVGECEFIDNTWPMINGCVCRLSNTTVQAVSDWQNESLPATKCSEQACTPNGAPAVCGG